MDGATGVANPLEGELTVYPNPTSGQLHVTYSGGELLRLEIFDGLGHLLRSREVRHSARFSLTELPVGVYLLRTTSVASGRFVVGRLVVSR
ncbi:T9SS type A sorting domain-containing protein [Neolewinella antarctica]|uniref:T9SS type A sorting domain-containing protein n=1 Tax=Neolewinella antarctica TaxID=442734 RepID=UPI0029FF3A58|nr:T9SS type A sorting domain-containing protein [Neolewinella antarctica]